MKRIGGGPNEVLADALDHLSCQIKGNCERLCSGQRIRNRLVLLCGNGRHAIAGCKAIDQTQANRKSDRLAEESASVCSIHSFVSLPGFQYAVADTVELAADISAVVCLDSRAEMI